MVTDMQHLDVMHSIDQELQSIIVRYNQMAHGLTDKKELIALRCQQLDELQESLNKNRRILKFLAGEKVEPVAHSAEAVLIGVGGLVG
jgi:hypothetical protein